MADDRTRVLDWLAANGRGYAACARALDLPVDQVRAWGKEARGSGSVVSAPPARARDPKPAKAAPPAPSTVDLDEVGRLEWQLGTALSDLEAIRAEPRSGTAIAALHRVIARVGESLDDARARALLAGTSDRSSPMTPEELRAEVLTCPESEFVVIEEAVADRRAGVALRLAR